ncbi:MAG: hypothetical protein LC748_14505 [Thermomicrobia bacterium]|nr:hypothetical protein [Thermomicrobia bacterium]
MTDDQRRENNRARTQAAQHSTLNPQHSSPFALPTKEYDLLDLLDRLESLVEDLDEFAITTRDEAEALIATIHARLDENE